MMDFRSKINTILRSLSRLLPTNSRFRQFLSRQWSKLLTRTGSSVTIPLAGRTIRVGNKYRHLNPEYEAESLALWQRLIHPGDTVWDVGANFGVYTIMSGFAVGPQGKVIAWEPAPQTFSVLKNHISINGLSANCQAENAAVGDSNNGSISFRVSNEDIDPTNRISSQPSADQANTISVPMVSLDGCLSRLGAPSIIKIDIEGAELLALKGAGKVLSPGGPRPPVMIAIHPMFLPEFGCTADDVYKAIDQYRYQVYEISGNRVTSLVYSEYLLIPEERAAELTKSLGWKY